VLFVAVSFRFAITLALNLPLLRSGLSHLTVSDGLSLLRRTDGKAGQQALEVPALAAGALRGLAAADDGFELAMTRTAVEVVNRHTILSQGHITPTPGNLKPAPNVFRRMSFIKRLLGRTEEPKKRVRVCVECGMPIAEHKDWCSIRRGQEDIERAGLAGEDR
jgi:hypothetical protein